MKNHLFLIILAVCALCFFSCGKEDTDKNSTDDPEVSPTTNVPDPEGTIMLSMRNYNNGRTYIDDRIFINSSDNFSGAMFVSVGEVKGLGNITTIPKAGWSNELSVRPGYGYIAYTNDKFYRIFVESYILAAETQGIIGAEVKYHAPFYGKDEELKLNKTSISFDEGGGHETISVDNSEIVLIDSFEYLSWLKISQGTNLSYDFLYNTITVSALENESLEERKSTIVISTFYGKKSEITVTQKGQAPYISVISPELQISAKGGSLSNVIESNLALAELSVSTDANWVSASINNNEVLLTVEKNYSSQSRTATVTISDSNKKASYSFDVRQTGGSLVISGSAEQNINANAQTVNFNLEGSPFEFKDDNEISVSSSESWCSVAYNKGIITCSVDANRSALNDREATITISSPYSSDFSVTAKIFQSKASLTLGKNAIWFDRNQSYETISFTPIPSDYDVSQIKSSASWCSFSTYGNEITIRCEATTEDREAEISFGGYSTKIHVTQSKYSVGMEYNEGGVSGTVCYMVEEERYIYQALPQYVAWSTELVSTGANDRVDGKRNMEIIKQIPNWENLYPAFKQVDDLNKNGVTGWFIPAIDVLLKVCKTDIWKGHMPYIMSSTEISASQYYDCYIWNYGSGYYYTTGNITKTDVSGSRQTYAFYQF